MLTCTSAMGSQDILIGNSNDLIGTFCQPLSLELMYTNYNLGPVSQKARKLFGPEGKYYFEIKTC